MTFRLSNIRVAAVTGGFSLALIGELIGFFYATFIASGASSWQNAPPKGVCMLYQALLRVLVAVIAIQAPFVQAGFGRYPVDYVEFAIIGAGIMGANVGMTVNELKPSASIAVFEAQNFIGSEASDTFNNAGTFHGAFNEMNYTPRKSDGTIEVSKAVSTNEMYELAKQFLAYMIERGYLADPSMIINPVDHIAMVTGENVKYLADRHEALSKFNLFDDIEFSNDPEILKKWMPLVMKGRDPSQPIAATRSRYGADIDFGKLTRLMFRHLSERRGVPVHLNHKVLGMRQNSDRTWTLKIKNTLTKETKYVVAKYVFNGAGGNALPLFQKAGIEAARGYAGFPVSGRFFVCTNKDLIEQHTAKVYGLAPVGAPPMSVPHADTRYINGEKALIFGPFPGITTAFSQAGNSLDWFKTIRLDNIPTLIKGLIEGRNLTGYLIREGTSTDEEQMAVVRQFIPSARLEDFYMMQAGWRVQIMNDSGNNDPVIKFGTETISSKDGSASGVYGASPGATIAALLALEVVKRAYGEEQMEKWRPQILKMYPSYGQKLSENPELARQVRDRSNRILRLGPKYSCRNKLVG